MGHVCTVSQAYLFIAICQFEMYVYLCPGDIVDFIGFIYGIYTDIGVLYVHITNDHIWLICSI